MKRYIDILFPGLRMTTGREGPISASWDYYGGSPDAQECDYCGEKAAIGKFGDAIVIYRGEARDGHHDKDDSEVTHLSCLVAWLRDTHPELTWNCSVCGIELDGEGDYCTRCADNLDGEDEYQGALASRYASKEQDLGLRKGSMAHAFGPLYQEEVTWTKESIEDVCIDVQKFISRMTTMEGVPEEVRQGILNAFQNSSAALENAKSWMQWVVPQFPKKPGSAG